MHNGCQPSVERNRKWPRQKLLLSSTVSNREWHRTSIPMCALENWKRLWPGQDRKPKISLHASRHWWTDARWSIMSIASMNYVALYHLCILPRGKAPRKSYGQAIQDTLQWAGWDCCEPLCHPICLGTSLPQLQTRGHNLPGQRVHGPHHPHQPWSHTICTLQGLSQLHLTAHSWQSKTMPSMWLPIVPNATRWDIGDPSAMVASHSRSRNAPPPGSQQRKSRCPPRNHNHCQGWQNKTHAIDVNEDHSPQDEIALHYIQPNMTILKHSPQRNHG